MKTLFIVLFSIISVATANAQFSQENDVEVQAILSPTSSQTYNSVDTFDIIVRIKNNGPTALIAGDQFKVNYSVGDGTPNSISVDTLILVGDNRTMQVGEGRTYTLAKDFIINGNNIFSACASVSGTILYPINTNKLPTECEQFVVNIDEQTTKIEQVYYSQQKVIIQLNQNLAKEVNIYDITGKLILSEKNINSNNISLPFSKKVKGFYFVNVVDQNGNQATAKFVVNQ